MEQKLIMAIADSFEISVQHKFTEFKIVLTENGNWDYGYQQPTQNGNRTRYKYNLSAAELLGELDKFIGQHYDSCPTEDEDDLDL